MNSYTQLIFAQEATPPPVANQQQSGTTSQPADGGMGPAGNQSPTPAPFGGGFMLILFGILLFMVLTSVFGGRKQRKQRQELLKSLERHDKVQTVGGMIGTIADIRDDEVVLKVDEATNTKIRFARSSVQQVLRKAASRTESSSFEEPEMVNS